MVMVLAAVVSSGCAVYLNKYPLIPARHFNPRSPNGRHHTTNVERIMLGGTRLHIDRDGYGVLLSPYGDTLSSDCLLRVDGTYRYYAVEIPDYPERGCAGWVYVPEFATERIVVPVHISNLEARGQHVKIWPANKRRMLGGFPIGACAGRVCLLPDGDSNPEGYYFLWDDSGGFLGLPEIIPDAGAGGSFSDAGVTVMFEKDLSPTRTKACQSYRPAWGTEP